VLLVEWWCSFDDFLSFSYHTSYFGSTFPVRKKERWKSTHKNRESTRLRHVHFVQESFRTTSSPTREATARLQLQTAARRQN